ncbi:3'-5' exoribonuclease YhaM family protein [Thermopirellula anaerolimosa]
MERRFIQQLGPQEQIREVYRAGGKQLRPNRHGALYLQVDLTDRTGSISARMWNATEQLYRSFENGDYVRVEGTTQVYQGALQLIVSRIQRVDPGEVDPADFTPVAPCQVDRLMNRLAELLRGLRNPALRNLAECFLLDETFLRDLAKAPAGMKFHHAYEGGLVDHIVNLMELARAVAPRYSDLDPELLLMGAFLHDIGKVRELTYEREYGYSDAGQLLGHLVIGTQMLEEKVRQAEELAGEAFPVEIALRLKHMIVSHHGQLDFGSPKPPMTLEALALHCLDHLDAWMAAFRQCIKEDPNVGSAWTGFHSQLNRKLFKGEGAATPSSEPASPESPTLAPSADLEPPA